MDTQDREKYRQLRQQQRERQLHIIRLSILLGVGVILMFTGLGLLTYVHQQKQTATSGNVSERFSEAASSAALETASRNDLDTETAAATDKAQHTDDRRVHQFAGDEAAEHAVDMRHTRHDGIRLFNREKAVRHLFRLCTEGVLAVENVQRDNDTDQQIHQHVYGRNNAAHHVAELRQQVVLRPVHYLCGELIVQAHEAVLNFRVVVQQRRHPAGYLVHIQVHRVYQRGDTRDQLRQHHPQQHAYNRQTEGQRQRAQAVGSRVPFLNLRDIGGCRLRYSMLNTGMSRYAITKP